MCEADEGIVPYSLAQRARHTLNHLQPTFLHYKRYANLQHGRCAQGTFIIQCRKWLMVTAEAPECHWHPPESHPGDSGRAQHPLGAPSLHIQSPTRPAQPPSTVGAFSGPRHWVCTAIGELHAAALICTYRAVDCIALKHSRGVNDAEGEISSHSREALCLGCV